MNVTVVTEESEHLNEALSHLAAAELLALDCEGVDLGRGGSISIIQLSSMERCYLFDVHGLAASAALVMALKPILESSEIVKIIHDVKMDADALFHEMNIAVTKVHDTQIWDKTLKGQTRNLNQTLLAYACEPNEERDANVYRANYRFWATRPLTEHMIDWASGDVSNLFELYERQCDISSPLQAEEAEAASERNCHFLRSCESQVCFISPRHMGRFIGPGGSNIRNLEKLVPGAFFQTRGQKNSGEVVVYAPDAASLARARRLLVKYS